MFLSVAGLYIAMKACPSQSILCSQMEIEGSMIFVMTTLAARRILACCVGVSSAVASRSIPHVAEARYGGSCHLVCVPVVLVDLLSHVDS